MSMSPHLDEMVAIASGSNSRVSAWGKTLRSAAIAFMVVTPVTASEGDRNDTELWVSSNDADEARHAISKSSGPDLEVW